MFTEKRPQKAWKLPVGEQPSKLYLYNSFTRKKELFVALKPKQVVFFNCCINALHLKKILSKYGN